MTARFLFGVTTQNTALAFLDGQLRELSDSGVDVHLICGRSNGHELELFAERNRVTVHEVGLSRGPRPLEDMSAIKRVAHVVRRVRPHQVIAGTPKMSLLLLGCSWAASVPRRVYICHGLRHEGLDGPKRWLFICLERFLCQAANEVAAVSFSVKQGLVEIGVPSDRTHVIWFGSPDGVDPEFFESVPENVRRQLLKELKIAPGARVASFVARLTRDKGIATLLATAEALPKVTFLVVGSEEPVDTHDAATINRLRAQPNVRLLGRRSDVRSIYSISDVFLLPTRREGLPTVILEASAAGVPTVAMDATGTRDVLIDRLTGRLVEQGSTAAFVSAVEEVLGDESLRVRLGQAAKAFTRERYEQHLVRRRWREFYFAST